MIIFCVIDYLCYHIKAKLPKFLKFIGQSHSTIHREEDFFFISILLFLKTEIVIFTHSNENGYEDNRGIETGGL